MFYKDSYQKITNMEAEMSGWYAPVGVYRTFVVMLDMLQLKSSAPSYL